MTRPPASLAGRGLAAIALLLLLSATAAAQVPPDERYLMFKTDHFRVIFPDGMESFARRAAASAEWAYGALSELFIEPPPGRIALVITNNTDRPNASATPIPSNRVVLIAAPDIASRTLNYYTDWVDQTLAHELTHIFHLDRATGIWGLAQSVFGRSPVFFPAFYQPRWVIEGLATYYESRLTGAGRAYGSNFDMLLNNDADAGDFRTVDAANGLSPIWPAGNTPYAYGGFYFRDMAEAHGDSAIAAFTERGAARLPYTLNWASNPYFGRTLTGSWEDWSAGFEAAARARADSLRAAGLTVGEPISGLAWAVSSPRFSPDGARVAFTFITPRDDPATLVLDAGTLGVVLRERRNSSGGNTWMADGSGLYLSQAEFRDRYDLYGDLYALDVARARERRLTVGARISSPDLSPDGRTLVAIETGSGSNRMVVIDLQSMEMRPLGPFTEGVNWEHPRWSPDGERIAAERWLQGEIADIVVTDRAGEVIWQVTRDDASDITPVWSPDGRYLLWASDRDGAYDIYAVRVSPGTMRLKPTQQRLWRLTRTLSGASGPDVSSDERWLAYAGLYPEGLRVERIPYDTATWEPAGPGWRALRQPPLPPLAGRSEIDSAVGPYSPFPSLWPKSWLPLIYGGNSEIGIFIGATTFGADDIRRHSYAILAGWRTGAKAIEAAAVYRYAGFGNTVMELGAAQDWSTGVVLTTEGQPVDVVEREREVVLAADFLRRRMRSVFRVAPLIGLQTTRFTAVDPQIVFSDPDFTDLLVGLFTGYSTARAYPRSVSLEKGFSAVLGLSHRRLTDDWDRWRVSAEAVLRGYLSFSVFGYANHVIAARLSVGASDGHDRSPEIFELGGIPGRAFFIVPGLAIGGGSQFPIRGYPEGVEFGDRIVSASLEYRFPLQLVGRGYGLWPILLDKLSVGLFVDAGSAWLNTDDVDVLASVGSELSVDLGLGYEFVYQFRVGLAIPIDDRTQSPSVYLAAGVAF